MNASIFPNKSRRYSCTRYTSKTKLFVIERLYSMVYLTLDCPESKFSGLTCIESLPL